MNPSDDTNEICDKSEGCKKNDCPNCKLDDNDIKDEIKCQECWDYICDVCGCCWACGEGHGENHSYGSLKDSTRYVLLGRWPIDSKPREDGYGFGYALPEGHPLYGVDAWENYPIKPDYTVHADVYRCIKCYRPVLDSDSAEEHQFGNKRHEYRCRVGYLQEHEKTYDGFIALMNRAIEQWGNPEYCYEWSHDMYGFCINCYDSNEIVIGECSVYSCTGCRYSVWNALSTFMIEITNWYEVIDDEISMCRSDIICNKPYLKEGSALSFYGQDQATFWCDTLLFSKTKPHNIIGNICIDCGYTEGDDQCNLCGNELCDFCGKCLDCDECDHCLDCNGDLCEDCEECVECSTNPCDTCCVHTWNDWTLQSHDENGHTQSRSCSKCDAEDVKAESHTRSLSSISWVWNDWDWFSVTHIKMLEDLLNTTIVLGKDSCQYRYRQCVVCDYLEYEIEDHKHGDDWDIRDYYEFYRIETGKWHIVPTEPYYVYIISLDLVPGSGDRLGNLDKCSRVKSCTNRGRDWTCPRFFDEPEPHVFKLYHECEKWEIYYGKERQHLFSNNGEKGGIYDSLSEIGNFEEIVIWLNDSNSMVSCKAGWCIRCGVSGSRAALTPQINKWHEWEGMCRRTIICIDNSQYDTTNFTFISIDTCNEILYEETKPHNVVGNTCIDCGYTVNGDTCTDFDCTDPHCPEHGNSSNNRCYFCGDNERCSLCNTCVNCDNCSHCTDCGARIWHNFEQYDPEIGYHWSIVPELIGDGTWDDIIEWLTNTQNFINCFGTKCSSCTTGQGKKITPIIKDWHERVYSDGFSACYRAIVCSECGDDVIAEAKVHNFKDDKCEDCGALKDGTNGNGGADIIITPSFTDSNFLADVRLLVGKTSDDEVYLSDVSKIQNYRAVTPGIQNFAGIEHFEDLTHFAYYAQWNIVESLDVTQNLKLQNLDIQRQRLTSLDLSKNSELINLNCRANNITAISLPTDSKLKELIINNNPLGSIDISKQKQLEHLQINTSQLTTLDLSSQERLIHLSATGNRLTSVDLSKNTELLSVDLQNNELTGLNVTNNKKITTLTIDRNNICTIDLSQNIFLSRFFADHNGMTSLDISKNTELREVYVNNNQLNTLDVSNNIKLNVLMAGGNNLTELNLSNNLQLVELRVCTNQISNLDVSMLTQLEYLSVFINNLTALNLTSNTKLVDLYCERNSFTQLDLSKNVMLRALDFSHNNLISIDLSNNPLLNYLRCGGNRLPNVNAVTLPSGVVWNDRIQFGTQKP